MDYFYKFKRERWSRSFFFYLVNQKKNKFCFSFFVNGLFSYNVGRLFWEIVGDLNGFLYYYFFTTWSLDAITITQKFLHVGCINLFFWVCIFFLLFWYWLIILLIYAWVPTVFLFEIRSCLKSLERSKVGISLQVMIVVNLQSFLSEKSKKFSKN